MKKMIPFILALLLLAGCQAPVSGATPDSTQETLLSRDTLRSKAFAHAGVNEADAWDLDEDYENRGSVTVYELDFEVNGVDYEYELDAKTGEILRSNTEGKPHPTEPTLITEDEAKRIALEHAGLTEGAVKSYTIELERDENKYEIGFFTKGIEYDYEIDAVTGEILKAEKDRD